MGEVREKMEKDSTFILDAGAATAGAVIGAVVAGPAGAVGGAAVGAVVQSAVQWIGNEIKNRHLAKSEEKKIGTVYELAWQKVNANLEAGKATRSDDFFTEKGEERSAATEITEEVFFAAQRESEEKKLPYLSNLYANILFDDTVDKPMAVQLLKIAEQLTFRQIQTLSILGGFQLATESTGYQPLKTEGYKAISGYKNISIATETFALYQQGLIQSKSAFFDPASIIPANLSLVGCGALLYNLMELSTLPFDSYSPEIIHFLSDKVIVEMTPQRMALKK